MSIHLERVLPADIEKRSFEIITAELGDRKIPADREAVVKRVIHTTADFEYADTLCFSENAVQKGIEALKNGATIVTDTMSSFRNASTLNAVPVAVTVTFPVFTVNGFFLSDSTSK